MNQFIFTLKNAWLGIASKKLLSIIVTAAAAIGMVFPISVLTQINYQNKNYGQPFYNDIEHTAVIECFCEVFEADRMKAEFTPPESNIKNVGFFATYSTSFVYGGKSWIDAASAYDSEYMKIGRTELLYGRFITEEELREGAKVCLAKKDNSHWKDVKPGDSVTIAGADFEVVGIVRDRKTYGSALIPYNALLKMTNSEDLQFKAYLQADGELDMDAIKVFTRKSETIEIIDSMSVRSALEVQEDLVRRVTEVYKHKLATGGAITLFSIISFTLIIIGRVMNEQYVLGVKTAMGATKWQLFIDLAAQNFILLQAAEIIAMILAYILVSAIMNLNGLFGASVIFEAEILVFALTFLITATAFFPFICKPVADMFRSGK